MKNSRITFIGTSNNVATRESKPGECSIMSNLERHNSTLRPISSYNFAGSVSDNKRKICYIHSCTGEQHLISVDENTIYHEADIVDGALVSVNKIITILIDTPREMNAFGNTLIINTDQNIVYIAYRSDGYKVLDNKPPMPIIRFREVCIENQGYITPEVTYEGCLEKPSDEDYDFFFNHIMAPIYKVRDEIHEKHAFFEPFLIRYALRLFDGSHILPSPPILINLHNYKKMLDDQYLTFLHYKNNDHTILQSNTVTWGAMGIEYIIDSINMNEWSDIVTGIDIFVSKEISLIEDRPIDEHSYYDTDGEKIKFAYKYKIPIQKHSFIEQSILNETLFYHLTTINISDITTQTPTLVTHSIKPDEIMYRPLMKVDTSSLSTIGARHTFIYNHRLHMADITQRFYPGYPPTLFCNMGDNTHNNAIIYMRTQITQVNGGVKETTAMTILSDFDLHLSPLISYPDCNAFSMEIGIRYNGYEYRKRIALQAVDNENRASYIEPKALSINIDEWYKVAITSDNIDDFPSSTSSFAIKQHNRMIVSEINNPFYFPDELSYYISNGTINGMAVATTALSQGQFGEFPLYIFTTEGIWSMQVGSGDICYTRCTSLNNERTNKQGFILPIEHAVVYLSGNNLSVISGSTSRVILPLSEIQPSNFNAMLPRLLPELTAAGIDDTPIYKYISDNTAAIYNHKKHELIIYNSNYSYCWILHIPSGHLYRWEEPIRNIVCNGENLFIQSNNGIIYNSNNEIQSFRKINLITKPLQFSRDMYSRLRQVVWRMQASHGILSLSVLASHEPDGTYKAIYRSTFDGAIDGHLPMRIFSAPYKYYRLALSGTLAPDATIDGVDMAFDIVENNKLR